MKFPASFIERLRNHFPVSEVLGKRITLKKHGREFQALCPFHGEKTPSFTVNDDKGFYHCFGCGAHGDAIKFLMEFERLGYREAVEKLAAEAGLPIPRMTREEEEREKKISTLHEAMEEACRWFEAQLAHPVGRDGVNYFRERGLTADTIRTFRLGYAPAARDALKQALLAKGVSETLLKEAGLLITPDDGPSYDRFRSRVIFPIRDNAGKVIAFGGRILGQATANTPKYLNSPETNLFSKGEVLYNFDLARKPARDGEPLIVTEGYMDVIALWQAGFKAAVAPLGTAITARHLQMMWRLSAEPLICLDGDNAGRKAMLRLAELALPLLTPGMSLKFVLLPGSEDPDTMIKHHGAGAMRAALEGARSLSRILWEHIAGQVGTDTPEHKAALEHKLMQLAQQIADQTVRNHYRSYFRDQLWGKPGKSAPRKTAKLQTALTPPQEEKNLETTLYRFEQQLVKLVVLYPDLLKSAHVEEDFARMDFTHTELDKLRQAILWRFGQGEALTRDTVRHAAAGFECEAAFDALMANLQVSIPKSLLMAEGVEAETHAQEVWRQAYGGYVLAKMKMEYQQAVARMAEEMSEEALTRCMELQKQIENRQKLGGLSYASGEQ